MTSLKLDFVFILYIKHVEYMQAEVMQIRFMIFLLTVFVISFNQFFAFIWVGDIILIKHATAIKLIRTCGSIIVK